MNFNFLLFFICLVNGQKILNETDFDEICFSNTCSTLCSASKIDAALNFRNGTIFAFKGNLFWEIMNKNNPPLASNAKLISQYWNISSKMGNKFKGPIDAALNDNKGYTYFFKKNKVFTFKGFSFIGSQIVENFDSINSALLIDGMEDNETNIFIFKGNNFWQIWSNTKMYNWLDTSSIFNIQDVEKIKPYFPTNIDSAFQDNDNNVIIIKGPQYISIPAHRFPKSIKNNDLIPKFIFKDIFHCEKSFYEKKFSSYDEFLIKLISRDFNRRREVHSRIGCAVTTCVQSLSNRYYLIIGTFIGIILAALLHCLYLTVKRHHRFSSEDKLVNYNARVRASNRRLNSDKVDLIRQNQISVDL